MNRLTIIGNLVRDPETRTTQSGKTVCSFTVAVNKARSGQAQEADFFKVSAWNKLAENCQQYLAKGRKVCVVGPVSASTYQANDGSTRVSLDVMANEVEFLSSRAETQEAQPEVNRDADTGFEKVDDPGDLPF